MKDKYCENISSELEISIKQVKSVLRLFDQKCTIPFISRYRKEATGGLDEEYVQKIFNMNNYFVDLENRKQYILNCIEEQGGLSDKLRIDIENEINDIRLEDIFLPYKKTKLTRAKKARNAGLDPLSNQIINGGVDLTNIDFEKYVCDEFPDVEKVKGGVKDILAEYASNNLEVRDFLRDNLYKYGQIACKKGKEDDSDKKYEIYYDYHEPISKIKGYRLLAIFRGVNDGILSVKIATDVDYNIRRIKKTLLHGYGPNSRLYSEAIEDGYKRLLFPSIENEVFGALKKRADMEAISVFSENLKQLLLSPPLGNFRIMAIDPGFRTGCKVVCLDDSGSPLYNETIYPHAPKNETKQAIKKVSSLVDAYKIDVIAVGSGTAGRETESFIKRIKFARDIKVFMVSEDGASIYSASKIAREEFPQYDVTVRGAISIGRRLMDPLAELIKIDPKSIGVGQYQYDVDQKLLKQELTNTVFYCVNSVGVNLNTASYHLLSYVSGLSENVAKNIVEYRESIGRFNNRKQLHEVPRLGDKTFEQCAGFLRIKDGDNLLDNTAVHPESYNVVTKIAKLKKTNVSYLINEDINFSEEDFLKLKEFGVGEYTLKDVLNELRKPGLDLRGEAAIFTFNKSIKTINDLSIGMLLPGLVTNLTNFGAFVDIGIKENGLVHISQITDRFISSPAECLKLHQQIIVKVMEVDIERKRIQLSIKEAKKR